MENWINDLLLVALSSLIAWFITHKYYLKSLSNQEIEQTKERNSLIQALSAKNNADLIVQQQNYIDRAVEEWKKKGTPAFFLETLSHLSKEQKYEIYRAASLRHKGREPKRNPYT